MTTGIGSCGSVSSNAGGRRTPGGKRRWRWAPGFAVPASAVSSRAVRSHSGLRRRRVSPAAAAHSAWARTSDRYPATAIGRPVAALSRGLAAVTDWTERSAATVGNAGSGAAPSRGEGAVGAGRLGATATCEASGIAGSGLGPASPASDDDHQEQRRHGQADDPQRAPDRSPRVRGGRLDDHPGPVPAPSAVVAGPRPEPITRKSRSARSIQRTRRSPPGSAASSSTRTYQTGSLGGSVAAMAAAPGRSGRSRRAR